LPATVDKVLAVSGQETLSFIGHSQGSLLGFVGFSINPELSAKVNLMIAMGPVGLLQHSSFQVGPFLEDLLEFMCGIKAPAWARENSVCDEGVYAAAHALLPTLCKVGNAYKFCIEMVCLLAGCESTTSYNSTSFPSFIFGKSYFAGTSAQNLNHFGQMLSKKESEVTAYDFGNKKENMAKYNQSLPPTYNLTLYRTKVAVFVGSGDLMADPTDAINTMAKLPPGAIIFNTTIKNYGHGDFNWALDAAELVYPTVIKLLNNASITRMGSIRTLD